jgi:hypothetical protein
VIGEREVVFQTARVCSLSNIVKNQSHCIPPSVLPAERAGTANGDVESLTGCSERLPLAYSAFGPAHGDVAALLRHLILTNIRVIQIFSG